MKYFKVWLTQALLSVQTSLENRTAAFLFTAGKFMRFGLFLGFLTLIHQQVTQVAGFTLDQMVTFFLVFNLFDLIGQLFFRGIYRFREQVISGEFDFRLTKPMSSLFQALTRHTDILDLPLLLLVVVMLMQRQTLLNLNFIIMTVVALIVITAVHIIVASLGVLTTEVDHTIMIYRDLSNMARFPVDIYTQLIRGILTFIFPIAIAYTLPAKALMGLLNLQTMLISAIISLLVFLFSLFIWKQALKTYSSASS